ncbi:hypothetical protein ACP70R_049055 [Stipagrostis hirtigluma subsp. patula]
MDRSWIRARPFTPEYINGVKEFMQFVRTQSDDNTEILCPCRRCLNQKLGPKAQVEDHGQLVVWFMLPRSG